MDKKDLFDALDDFSKPLLVPLGRGGEGSSGQDQEKPR